MERKAGGSILFLVVLLVGALLAVARMQNDQDKIREWASENDCTVVEIEKQVFSHGPFWFKNEDQEIYRVKLKNHFEADTVAWFRIGTWSFDQEWEE